VKKLFASAVATLFAATAGASAAADDAQPAQPTWRFAATAYGYAIPGQPAFVMATLPIDIRWFHVEGRYNYEALHTGSAFLGVTGRWGDSLKLGLTTMIGGTYGDLRAVVPATRLTISWWKLDLFSETETVIDLRGATSTFFYDWTELGVSPVGWLRFGPAIQRSLVFQTSLDVQRGLFAGVGLGVLTLTFYEFNAGWITPTFVVALGVTTDGRARSSASSSAGHGTGADQGMP
jgi:hypothetical protein